MTRSVSYSALDEATTTEILRSPSSVAPEAAEKLLTVGATVPMPPPSVTHAVEEAAAETEEEMAVRIEREALEAEKDAKRLRVVLISSECAPWSKSGGLADVASKLSIALSRRGHRVMTVSPSYRHYEGAMPTDIRKTFTLYGGSHEVHYTHMWCPTEVGGDPNTTKIGVDRIFVQNGCFERAGMYGDPGGHEYFDNLFRFALFSWAAVEAPLLLPAVAPFGEKVIFIANDWQTGLVPLILSSHYRRWRVYEPARCLFIIHNMGYHGNFPNPQMYNYNLPDPRHTPKWTFCDLGLADNLFYDLYKWIFPPEERGDGGVVDDGECVKLLMGGIMMADRVVTVSPAYKEEVLSDQGGWGLQEKVRSRNARFDGILNGIDTEEWDPAKDEHLVAHYNAKDTAGKQKCKLDLQAALGLEQDVNKPLIAFIGRLAPQKGIDLIEQSVHWLMGGDDQGVLGDAQLVMMGSGEHRYAEFMRNAEGQYKGRICGYVGFSASMEHKIIAGADILLMPSRYEPCGLPQMYAQRYGTIPIVHATGGLKDSVAQYEQKEGGSVGTGWKFGNCDAGGLQWGLWNALKVYKKDKEEWAGIMERGMTTDFSWDGSAAKYEQLFEWAQMDEPVHRPWQFQH